jgi:hypothetical protein
MTAIRVLIVAAGITGMLAVALAAPLWIYLEWLR